MTKLNTSFYPHLMDKGRGSADVDKQEGGGGAAVGMGRDNV